jgi:hypothetical protein
MQITALAHELGHAMQPVKISRGSPAAEVFSEVVSCLVMEAFGLDTREAAFSYIYLANLEGTYVMQLYSKEIDKIVSSIVAGVKAHQ